MSPHSEPNPLSGGNHFHLACIFGIYFLSLTQSSNSKQQVDYRYGEMVILSVLKENRWGGLRPYLLASNLKQSFLFIPVYL